MVLFGQEENGQLGLDIQNQKGDTGVSGILGDEKRQTSGFTINTNDFTNRLSAVESNVRSHERSLEELSLKSNDLKIKFVKLEKVGRELEKTKESLMPNMLSVFGIFASIVTFLVTEVQIYKTICDPFRALGVSFLVFSMLALFLTVILYYFANKNRSYGLVFALVSVFLGLGAYMFVGAKSEAVCGDQNLEKKYDDLRIKVEILEKMNDSFSIDVSNRVK